MARSLHDAGVRHVLIGVWGANYYAPSGASLFQTADSDRFLPPDPDNLLRAWATCEACGLDLSSGGTPLDLPRDDALARAVVDRRALTQAADAKGLAIDLTLVMTGFAFDDVEKEARTFVVERLAGRKDELFLETHREALDQLLGRETDE